MCYWRVTNDDLQSRWIRKSNWATRKSLTYTDGKHDKVRRKWQKFMSSTLWQCVNTSTLGGRNQKTKSCWNEMFIRHNQNEGCGEQDEGVAGDKGCEFEGWISVKSLVSVLTSLAVLRRAMAPLSWDLFMQNEKLFATLSDTIHTRQPLTLNSANWRESA